MGDHDVTISIDLVERGLERKRKFQSERLQLERVEFVRLAEERSARR